MRIILASQSPRRREILEYFSLPFMQVASNFDESTIPFNPQDPQGYVCALAQAKSQQIAQHHPNAVILAADTIVYREGKIFGKPRTFDEAFQFFSELVGNWHSVYTGVCVQKGSVISAKAEVTKVLFNPLNADQIKQYLQHVEWKDKAGGYAIQAVGGLIVRKIDGCYYNVMGLPINVVEELLKQFGIELWDHL